MERRSLGGTGCEISIELVGFVNWGRSEKRKRDDTRILAVANGFFGGGVVLEVGGIWQGGRVLAESVGGFQVVCQV